MPYIKQELRDKYDPIINQLVNLVKESDIEEREGDLNYIVTRVVLSSMKPETGWRYKFLARAKAILTEARDEVQNRLLKPYEQRAKEKNGDLKEYE